MTPDALARLYYQYFNERRFDEAGLLVDPEAVFHYVPTKQRLVGRAGYRALVAGWVIAFEDASVEIVSAQHIDGENVRVEFIGHGTHTGDLVLGEALTIPATGTLSALPFTDTLTIRNGLVCQSRFEFDVEELWHRLTEGAPHLRALGPRRPPGSER